MEIPRRLLLTLGLSLSLGALAACSKASSPVDGGAAGPVIADGITEIGVSGDTLFYLTSGLGDAGATAGAVYRTSVHGGATDTIESTAWIPSGLVVTADHAYWQIYDTGAASTTIKRVPLAGGTPEIFARGLYEESPFLLDGENAYYLTSSRTTIGLAATPLAGGAATVLMPPTAPPGQSRIAAVDASKVYFFSSLGMFGATPGVYAVPRAGGAPALVQATTENLPPRVVAQDAQSLYFSYGNDVIDRMPLAGGAPVAFGAVAPGGDSIGALVVDGSDLYFSTSSALGRVPGAGGATTTLLQTALSVVSFTLAPGTIYWAGGSQTSDQTTIFELAR